MEFKPITFEDFHRLEPYFKDQPYRLCSYSLSSIIAWQTDFIKTLAMVENDTLIIGCMFKDNPEDNHLLLPISPENGDMSPEQLRDLAIRNGFRRFWFVPDEIIEKHGTDEFERFFTISHERAYDDYVYRRDDLAYLKGNKFSKKRNLVNQFKREYLQRNRVALEPITPEAVPECLDFLEQWCEAQACDVDQDHDLACEKQAAINTLKHIELTDSEGLLARVDGRVRAFGIACRLTNDMGVLHFEKADVEIKGLYQYFDQMCAQQLFDGMDYINKESDMDVPGLAKAKRSYKPVMMITANWLRIRE